jgi:hypothetical protein
LKLIIWRSPSSRLLKLAERQHPPKQINVSLKIKPVSKNSAKVLFETNLPVVFAFQAVSSTPMEGTNPSTRTETNFKLMTNDNETIKETGNLCDQLGTGFAHFQQA